MNVQLPWRWQIDIALSRAIDERSAVERARLPGVAAPRTNDVAQRVAA